MFLIGAMLGKITFLHPVYGARDKCTEHQHVVTVLQDGDRCATGPSGEKLER